MNIFLPYADNIVKSVQSLDNRRLVKQILETKTLLDFALGNSTAYGKHPVAQFYKDNPDFLAYYGMQCCVEYYNRTNKFHSLIKDFAGYIDKNAEIEYEDNIITIHVIGYFADNKKIINLGNIPKIDIIVPVIFFNGKPKFSNDNIDGHILINLFFITPNFIPYYIELPKTDLKYIRFSGNSEIVSKLFQAKLIKKWLNDKHKPKWGTRDIPDFFKEYLELNESSQKTYWENVEQLKGDLK